MHVICHHNIQYYSDDNSWSENSTYPSKTSNGIDHLMFTYRLPGVWINLCENDNGELIGLST